MKSSEPAGRLRLTGRVVDAAGHGVAGARVWIDSVPMRATTSEGDGSFELDGLLSRSYEVRAQADERIAGPQVVRLTAHAAPMVIELGEGARVVVTVIDLSRAPIANASVRVVGRAGAAATNAAGQAMLVTHPGFIEVEATAPGYAPRREGASARVSRVPERVAIVMHEGFAISGRILDETGTPILNARVYAHGYFPDVGEENPLAVSDEHGVFMIPSAVGTHHLFAIDDEHAPTRVPKLDVDRAITDLEIVMKAGGVYAGHVVDDDGKVVAQARVYLHAVAVPGPELFFATSDANGAFEIRGLPHTLKDEDAFVYAATDEGISDDRNVALSKELRGEQLLVRRRDTTGVITGIVVDDTGAPVANALVNAAPRSTPPPEPVRCKVMPRQPESINATSTRANERGEFELGGVAVGEYGVWPGAFSQEPFSGLAIAFFVGMDIAPFNLARTGDTDTQLLLPRAGRIIGKVAFVDTGEPVERFEVDLFGDHEIATGFAGEHGAFDVGGLRPVGYRIQIRGPRFSEAWTGIEVGAGETADVGTIAIQRGRTVRGAVVDSTGRGVAGASVILGDGIVHDMGRLDATLDPKRVQTDAHGAFVLEGVAAKSRLMIEADHPTLGRSVPIVLPPGPQPEITLALLGCGSIHGRLTRAGQPLSGASVAAGSPQYGQAIADEAGAFVLGRLPVGPVRLSVTIFADGLHRSHATTADVEAGKSTEIVIEVPAGTINLTVNVTPAPGAVLGGAKVSLFRGTVAVRTYADLLAQIPAYMPELADWCGDAVMPVFERLVPGEYTVCTMPLASSPRDRALMERVSHSGRALEVVCTAVRVVAAPTEQTLIVEVPAMQPF